MTGKADRWALVVGDGKPGHENQSLAILPDGIAPWCFRPRYRNFAVWVLAVMAARFPPLSALFGPFPWPRLLANGGELAEQLAHRPPPAVVVSTGSAPAPVTVLTARHARRPAVTCGAPSLGLAPFDLACVPRHDKPPRRDGIVETVGAPNRVDPDRLKKEGEAFAKRHELKGSRFICLLLGGEAPHHTIPPKAALAMLDGCLALAGSLRAQLLVTTSRRTGKETEDALSARAGETAYFCAGRTDPEPVVTGMLALADIAVVSEDSVSMVSEAASAPCRVLTVGVTRAGGRAPRRHEAVIAALAGGGYVHRVAAADLAEAGQTLAQAPPPPVLDDTRRCREEVAALIHDVPAARAS